MRKAVEEVMPVEFEQKEILATQEWGAVTTTFSFSCACSIDELIHLLTTFKERQQGDRIDCRLKGLIMTKRES